MYGLVGYDQREVGYPCLLDGLHTVHQISRGSKRLYSKWNIRIPIGDNPMSGLYVRVRINGRVGQMENQKASAWERETKIPSSSMLAIPSS